MNVSQYSPNRKLERDSIGSIDALPSVKEAIGRVSHADSIGADATEVFSGSYDDGFAVYRYAVDGSRRCVIQRCELKSDIGASELRVPDNIDGFPVTAIGGHAFSTCYGLRYVGLPEAVEEIREHAFMNTALERFDAPPALCAIGPKAFFRCEQLGHVQLNEGLLFIGEGAFLESALHALDVPATVSHIGRDAIKGTRIPVTGPDATLRIREGGAFCLQDGALYCEGDDGLALVQLLDEGARAYDGPAALAHVGERAFAGKRLLRSVKLAEGLIDIGEAAFRGCIALEDVALPESLQVIGRQAFRQTSLSSLRIPASLKDVGAEAFYTGGSVARDFRQTIQSVEVSPENPIFYIEEDTLCQRKGDVAVALLHFGSSEHVIVPRSATEIGPYAFLNSRHATCVTLHDRIRSIDAGGLDFGRSLSAVIYEMGEGQGERYVIRYPPGSASSQIARITFGGANFDIEFAFAEADSAILHAQDLFTRSRMMVERLEHPVFLQKRIQTIFRNRLRTAAPASVIEFGRNGYMKGVDSLIDLGLLDEDNIEQAIEAANDAGEIAVLNRLIKARHTHFNMPMFDFDL